MEIIIIGAGYVGLITGACLAELGHTIYCIENDIYKVNNILNGIIPYEKGLNKLIKDNIIRGKLSFTKDLDEVIDRVDVIFICVGTPEGKKGRVDLSQVDSVIDTLIDFKINDKVIVEKSTVPVNTYRRIQEKLREKGLINEVVSNPEFLKEGTGIADFMDPDRIVIGVNSSRAKKIMEEIYEPLKYNNILYVGVGEAELIKYASNSFLATKISFINLISEICTELGLDIKNVSKGIGLDKRIGNSFLNAGIGYGGSCFPKDIRGFIKVLDDLGIKKDLLVEVESINRRVRANFFKNIEKKVGIGRGNKTLTVWGLSFKPGTDDIRESPAIELINKYKGKVNFNLYDPVSMPNFMKETANIENITYYNDPHDSVIGSNALIILTDWIEFSRVNWGIIKENLEDNKIFDGRNLLDDRWKGEFEYYGVGR